MRKRLISILLVLTLLFGVYTQSYATGDEALRLGQVVVDGVALGTGALSGGLALLAALGVSIISTDGGQQAVVDLYNYCDSVNKQAIADMHGDLIRAKSVLWEQASSFVNATYQVGESLRRTVNFVIDRDGVVQPGISGAIQTVTGSNGEYCWTDGITVHYSQINSEVVKDEHEYTSHFPVTLQPTNYKGSIDYGLRNINGELCRMVIYDYYVDVIDATGKRIDWVQIIRAEYYPPDIVDIPPNTGELTMDEAGYYDYTRSGVAIPVPQSVDGDRVIAIPQSIPYTGGIGITGDMVIPATDALTDATTHVDSETGEPETNEFRPPEMQVPPALGLTRKFPFSIPWDLKLAVTSLVAEPKAPHWEINWDSQYFVGGGKTVIDFEQYEIWAKVIRWGLLILFNYFLIINTRRLIGAS